MFFATRFIKKIINIIKIKKHLKKVLNVNIKITNLTNMQYECNMAVFVCKRKSMTTNFKEMAKGMSVLGLLM